VSFTRDGDKDILKRRLTRFVLAFWNLVNSSFQNIATLRCPRVCIYIAYAYRVPYMIYIRRGLRCCCLERKAIPEPQNAEQQDCSPAFNFMCKNVLSLRFRGVARIAQKMRKSSARYADLVKTEKCTLVKNQTGNNN